MLQDFIKNFDLPRLFIVHQRFPEHPSIDIKKTLKAKLAPYCRQDFTGMSIAVCVGSRGIDNIVTIVKTVIESLKACGAHPFILPAMGSHGGATAEGQKRMLSHLGITPETTGAPIRSSMETVSLGNTDDGVPLMVNKLAVDSDGIVLINRIKPHTQFNGPTESGILKILVIGLGNQIGADIYHRLGTARDLYEVISSAGRALIDKLPFIFGVAMVEDQLHHTYLIEVTGKDDTEKTEKRLLKIASQLMPAIPVPETDILIVDEIGKNICGAGIDPNVVGRSCVLPPGIKGKFNPTRILIRDLTTESQGIAMGLGVADVILEQLAQKVDMRKTAINALTGCAPEHLRLPLTLPNDRQALMALLMTIRPFTVKDLKIVHIKNSLELGHIVFSEAYLEQLHSHPTTDIVGDLKSFQFDENGFFLSPLHSC